MSAISRKTKSTSTTIYEYPAPSRLESFLAGCCWVLLLLAMALAGGALGFFAFNLW